jgi:hypothetical protein
MTCKSCRRELRWQSVKLNLTKCRQCRKRDKRMSQTRIGEIAGESIYLAIRGVS